MTPVPPNDTLHRRVVHALATRPPLGGIVVLDYGLRYAAGALRGGARWALSFAGAAFITLWVVIGAPRALGPIDLGGPEAALGCAPSAPHHGRVVSPSQGRPS
jgi:hypothetical protein